MLNKIKGVFTKGNGDAAGNSSSNKEKVDAYADPEA